jgi:hypothetical protein
MRRDGGIKQEAARLSLDAMNRSEPSEGIRASEIIPLTGGRFEIRHFRNIGGTLLLLVLNEIAGNFREDDAEIMPLVNALIATNGFEAVTNVPGAMISADPSPFVADSRGLGQTTIAWTSYATSKVEVRVDAPNGEMFTASGPGRFSKTTGPMGASRNDILFAKCLPRLALNCRQHARHGDAEPCSTMSDCGWQLQSFHPIALEKT